MTRIARLVAVLVVVNTVVALLAVLVGAGAAVGDADRSTGPLRLVLPTGHPAGVSMSVRVEGYAVDVVAVDIVIATAAGTVRLQAPIAGDAVSFEIAGEALVAAGPAVLWAVAGGDQAMGIVEIEPGPAVDPVVPFAGPKSIVSDGVDHAMVVALPADANGNAVPGRDELIWRSVRPDGSDQLLPTMTTGLVTWSRVTAGFRAGRSVVSAALGAVSGPSAAIDEVADRPVDFALSWTDDSRMVLVADGRRLHRLATDRIVDRHGNVVPDGTAVVLRASETTGARQMTAVTIDGRAEFFIESPTHPGPLAAAASVGGATSNEIVLDFGPAPQEVPVTVVPSEGAFTLRVGPVVSTIGGWVPDGTEVRFRTDADGDDHVAVLRDGFATVTVGNDLGRLDGSIVVLGVAVEVTS